MTIEREIEHSTKFIAVAYLIAVSRILLFVPDWRRLDDLKSSPVNRKAVNSGRISVINSGSTSLLPFSSTDAGGSVGLQQVEIRG
ncbi:hypothetical protein TNIN_448951 [Trichonephila inaurata madagascariensis]|uniref:Uncharacterized protein n=1 Tax=Trichonephila inaurata madagascariensis TaxID=2747483 RepID=A0A8X7CFI4_9ARAC|nr:hypothetical protein TNIN_448951 [Trichonephila inaurata madagascariensis]